MTRWSVVWVLMLASGCGIGPANPDASPTKRTLKLRPCGDAEPEAWTFDGCSADLGAIPAGSSAAALIELDVAGFPEGTLPSASIVAQVGDWTLEIEDSSTELGSLPNGTHTLRLTVRTADLGEVYASVFVNGHVPGGVNESYDGNPDRQGVPLAATGTVVAVGSSANRE